MIKIILVGLVLIALLSVVGFIGWYLYMKARFKSVKPNEALIITGPNLGDVNKETNIFKDEQGRYIKVVRGGGVRLKMFQSAERVGLNSFTISFGTPTVYTKNGVGIVAEAVATVKVADELKDVVRYAEQFLGKSEEERDSEIRAVLETSLRTILANLTVEEINGDRESFNDRVKDVAQRQLNDMGFMITSLGLSDIKDKDNYLESLGKPKIAEVKKTAQIKEAESRQATELKNAEVEEIIAKERIQREMNIAEEQKSKDLREEQIKAETEREKARAEASYELEKEIKKLEVEERRLAIKKQERERELEIERIQAENNILIEEKKVEVAKKQADQRAYEKRVQAKAEADYNLEIAKSDAESIRERGFAEAEAIRERARAIEDNKEAVLAELMIKALPEFARAISEPMSNVESIRILDGGNGKGINSLSHNITNNMAQIQDSMSQMVGVDLKGIVEGLTKGESKPKEDLDTKDKIDLRNLNITTEDIEDYLNNLDKEDKTEINTKTEDEDSEGNSNTGEQEVELESEINKIKNNKSYNHKGK